MPGEAKRPAFLPDWRNIGLIILALVALLLMAVLALSPNIVGQNVDGLAPAGKPSVAVLPLNSLSNDEDQAFLADAIAEDVITLLSRNPRFFCYRSQFFVYLSWDSCRRTSGR